jgi:hypothetical protein
MPIVPEKLGQLPLSLVGQQLYDVSVIINNLVFDKGDLK